MLKKRNSQLCELKTDILTAAPSITSQCQNQRLYMYLPHRHCKIMEPCGITLYPRRDFGGGDGVRCSQEHEMCLWATQNDHQSSMPDGLDQSGWMKLSNQTSSSSSLSYSSSSLSSSCWRIFCFHSMILHGPVQVTFFAYFPRMSKLFVIPLIARTNLNDIGAFINKQSRGFASVLNPFGSGAFAHWPDHDIEFYLRWSIIDDGDRDEIIHSPIKHDMT